MYIKTLVVIGEQRQIDTRLYETKRPAHAGMMVSCRTAAKSALLSIDIHDDGLRQAV